MEILNIVEKFGIPTLWGYLMYLLLRDIIKKLFNGFADKLSEVIDELKEVKEELKEIKEELKKKNVGV